MSEPVIYECTSLDSAGECQSWQQVPPDNEFLPTLTQAEQSQLTIAILSVMGFVWLIKQLKRAF